MDQYPTQKLAAIPAGFPAGPLVKRRIDPFPFQGLPSISRAQTRLVNTLLDALPFDEEDNVLDMIGHWLSEHLAGDRPRDSWRVSAQLVAPTGPDISAREFDHAFSTMITLPPGSERVLVAIDPTITRAFLTALLEDFSPRREQPSLNPGHFEGGVITSVLLGICQQLSTRGYPPVVVATAQADAPGLHDWFAMHKGALIEATFTLMKPGVRGWIRVIMSSGFLCRLIDARARDEETQAAQVAGAQRARLSRAPFAELPLSSKVILGAINVPAREAFRLRPGDLLLPETHGLRVEALRPCEGYGKIALDRRNYLRCLMRPEEGLWQLEIVESQPAPTSSSKEMNRMERDEDNSNEATMALATGIDLKVEVHLGRFNTTMGELTGMRRGSIVELETPVGNPVDLVVDGQHIGRGELVIIEGHLGVRILSMGKQKS